MKNSSILFILTFFVAVSLYAQKQRNIRVPVSIYTSAISNNRFNFSTINKKLDLSNFSFIFVSTEDLEFNLFSIDAKNIDKKPSKFICDDYDYKRNQDRNLSKDFLFKNDPTYWNLHEQSIANNNFQLENSLKPTNNKIALPTKVQK
ncbi:MAG: hypothetical protein ACWIPJ_04765 [Polaribacter sp.]